MREIKFRAWVKSEKAMIQHREVIERAHLQFNDSLNNTDIVMQYTGLKDKNNVEIFEGDLLHCPSIELAYYKVVFDNGCFELYHRLSRWGLLSRLYELTEPEVIGNIYENPELLK